MKTETKEILDRFFTKHYTQLIEIATVFITNPELNAYDLVSTLYMTIMNSKERGLKSIENAIANDNLFNFIYVSLRYQARGKTTLFNKYVIKDKTDLPNNLVTEQGYTPSDDEKMWLIATKELHNMRDNKQITDYELTLFYLYYMNEELVDIKDKSLKEVNKIRNMSLRALSNETSIGYMSIHSTTQKVLKILKNNLKEKNIL